MNKYMIEQMKAWSERQFQNWVLSLAEALGWLAYHTHDSRRSHKGFPDLVLIKGARLIFAELKAEKGRLKVEQKQWGVNLKMVALENDYVEYYLWRPRDANEIEEVLA